MAKNYEFRFETLLRMRQQIEDEKKRAVAARLREIRTLEERQRTFVNRISEQMAHTRASLVSDRVDVDDLRWGRHWMIRLRRGVLETEAALNGQRAVLAQERRQLAEAATAKKVLARLKERRRVAYLAEQNRHEQLELDEISVMQFAGRMPSRGGDEE